MFEGESIAGPGDVNWNSAERSGGAEDFQMSCCTVVAIVSQAQLLNAASAELAMESSSSCELDLFGQLQSTLLTEMGHAAGFTARYFAICGTPGAILASWLVHLRLETRVLGFRRLDAVDVFDGYDDGDALSQENVLRFCGGQHSGLLRGTRLCTLAAWADSRMTGMRNSVRHACRQYLILG